MYLRRLRQFYYCEGRCHNPKAPLAALGCRRSQTVYDSHYCTVKEEIVDNLDEAPVTKEATVKKETLEKVSLMSLL